MMASTNVNNSRSEHTEVSIFCYALFKINERAPFYFYVCSCACLFVYLLTHNVCEIIWLQTMFGQFPLMGI